MIHSGGGGGGGGCALIRLGRPTLKPLAVPYCLLMRSPHVGILLTYIGINTIHVEVLIYTRNVDISRSNT